LAYYIVITQQKKPQDTVLSSIITKPSTSTDIISDKEAFDLPEDMFMIRVRGTKKGDIHEIIGWVLKFDKEKREIVIGKKDHEEQSRTMEWGSMMNVLLVKKNESDNIVFETSNIDAIVEGKTLVAAKCVQEFCKGYIDVIGGTDVVRAPQIDEINIIRID